MNFCRNLRTVLVACMVGIGALATAPLSTFAQEGIAQTAQQDVAQVRVVHASPDAPAVDVYINGDVVDDLTNVPFFTASPYLELPADEYRIQVAPAGTSAADAVIDATATLEAGQAYTIAATGLLDDIQATVIEDTLDATAPDEARVAVYHFSPDAPAVDVKLADGTVLASNVAFPTGREFTVPAGTYDIVVTPAGADQPVVIDLADTTLEAGNTYAVFATNVLDSLTPQLVVTNVGTTGQATATAAPTTAATATPAAAATATPAPAATQAATPAGPSAPSRLPQTSEGDTLPIGLLIVIATLLLGGGTLLLALRRRSMQ